MNIIKHNNLAVILRFVFPALIAALANFSFAQTVDKTAENRLPDWTKKVGARKSPQKTKNFWANDFGANADGRIISTAAIQKAIDDCAKKGGGIVGFKPGNYLTGAIFLKNNVNLRIDEGVTLIGSQDEKDYPEMPTRVAGIEMKWLAGLINVNDATNVKISGGGTIDGNGKKWWDKYWSLRKEYDPKGLRWASDYDAERVRLMVVWQSSNVTVENLSLRRSGFWTVQIVYSDHVTVDKIKISDNEGPSTDGVDIDSSSYVLVKNSDIDNNDDDICLKSGRDSDGMRVNRPTEFVIVRDNSIRRGGGVLSFGSETSGGIRHVVALNNRGIGTKEGVRFKSAKTRGGYVEDVLIDGLKMENVPLPFTFTLNWNPSYSYATIPAGMKDVPPYWIVLNTPITPPEKGFCDFHDIIIRNVEITGAKQIFTVSGLPEKLIQNVKFENVKAQGNAAGSIEYAKNWMMLNVNLKTANGETVKISNSERVESPTVSK